MNQLNKKPTQISTAPQSEKAGVATSIIIPILAVVAVALAAGLTWAIWFRPAVTSSPTTSSSTAATTGPCYNNAPNNLPAGYSWYENAALGYKFAYPTSWGAVTVSTAPMGGVSGSYASGGFASKSTVRFGGNATDYVVNARGGMLTDNPGFLEASGKFYTVQIWQYHDATTGTTQPQYGLHLISETTTARDACNTKAAISTIPYSDFFGHSYTLARINLQPTNLYYGVNFELQEPTAADLADLDKIIASFQLIP